MDAHRLVLNRIHPASGPGGLRAGRCALDGVRSSISVSVAANLGYTAAPARFLPGEPHPRPDPYV